MTPVLGLNAGVTVLPPVVRLSCSRALLNRITGDAADWATAAAARVHGGGKDE